jgi:hypothetical protein
MADHRLCAICGDDDEINKIVFKDGSWLWLCPRCRVFVPLIIWSRHPQHERVTALIDVRTRITQLCAAYRNSRDRDEFRFWCKAFGKFELFMTAPDKNKRHLRQLAGWLRRRADYGVIHITPYDASDRGAP